MDKELIAYAKEHISYNPETGEFRWIKKPPMMNWKNRCNPGDLVGYIHSKGYRVATLKGKHIQLHRLAWIFIHGEIATETIDHINGVRHDNRICNLRLATRTQNAQNASARKKHGNRIKNVSWDSESGKWRVRVVKDGKRYHGGRFEDPNEAEKVAKQLMKELHGEFARFK
jgi:hypothetical protein